jgi:ATP-dependent Clp protease ATP-binding subunit ClpC
MYQYFTQNAKTAINHSKKTTNQMDLKKIKATDIINAIIEKDGCYGKNIITSLDAPLKKKAIEKLKKGSVLSAAKLILSAVEIAYASHSNLVGTEHLVQAFIEMELSKELENLSLQNSRRNSNNQTPDEIQKEINNMLNELLPGGQLRNVQKNNALKTYCVDLSKTTSKNPPLIGKLNELSRLTHILGRKNKNNPMLIGDPGVGKTAIVEGLAQKIKTLDVPHHLINKRIFLLDLGQLIAGTTFRGEFESRLKDIMHAVKKDGNIILFIDEIHTLIGAGNATGGMDAANILKPAMARGEIQIIGATTIDEYKKHIEKDSALERRLQPLIVKEPSSKESIKILQGIKKHYENYHQVTFDKDSVQQAVILAKKYITNRFLPDSAIDLLDETAARKRSQIIESNLIKKHCATKECLTKLLDLKDTLVLKSQYDKALEIKQNEEALVRKLQKEKKIIEKLKNQQKIIINKQDILETLSSITNISPALLSNHNSKLTSKVSRKLKTKLVGQTHVKKKINEIIIRRLSGISRQQGPLGSFLFIGPTGVGKTMTAKLLAEAISPDSSPSLIQINMSEFTEKHSLSRLLGAPAGYVGHENSGELSDKILRNPFSVVLFDEIEKADPGILNILLQILEEGELMDTKNKKLNFRNTLVILTSNIGTNELNKISSLGFNSTKNKAISAKKEIEKTILNKLEKSLAPELLARLDSTLVFDNLQKKEISKIIVSSLEELKRTLKKRKITLVINESIVTHLTTKSLAKAQGARLIRKNIQDLVEPLLAKELLKKKVPSKITLLVKNGKISIKK